MKKRDPDLGDSGDQGLPGVSMPADIYAQILLCIGDAAAAKLESSLAAGLASIKFHDATSGQDVVAFPKATAAVRCIRKTERIALWRLPPGEDPVKIETLVAVDVITNTRGV